MSKKDAQVSSSKRSSTPAKDPYVGTAWPTLSIAVAIIAVSFASILIKWSSANPLMISFYRLLFTLFLLIPSAATTMRKELKETPLGGKEAALLLGVGVVLACHFALWVTSLTMTTVASSVLLVTFHPVFVGIIAVFFLKERLSKINVIGMAIAFVGTFVLLYGDFTTNSGTSATNPGLGDLLAFLGGLAAGGYILAGRYFRKTRGLITYVFMVYLGCTVTLFIMCVVANLTAGVPFVLPPKEYLLFLLMALGPGIFGHTVYNWALKYVKATLVSVSLLGEPIGASILAFLLLAQVPTTLTLIGGVGILIGIYLTAYGMADKEAADSM